VISLRALAGTIPSTAGASFNVRTASITRATRDTPPTTAPPALARCSRQSETHHASWTLCYSSSLGARGPSTDALRCGGTGPRHEAGQLPFGTDGFRGHTRSLLLGRSSVVGDRVRRHSDDLPAGVERRRGETGVRARCMHGRQGANGGPSALLLASTGLVVPPSGMHRSASLPAIVLGERGRMRRGPAARRSGRHSSDDDRDVAQSWAGGHSPRAKP
jgi:hypothetical protein